jgi:DNA-binding protein HU-beta
MTKQNLIAKIVAQTGQDEELTQQTITAFLEGIKRHVSRGETIYMRGFGSFGPKLRAAKKARNLKTGAAVLVPAQYVPAFKPAETFKEAVRKQAVHT